MFLSFKRYCSIVVIFVCFSHIKISIAEPVVVKGEVVKDFIGTPIKNIRIINSAEKAIPFQIDEVTPDGEYVCDLGEQPNSDLGNGILDPQDEIVFLWEDCDTVDHNNQLSKNSIRMIRDGMVRQVYICSDTSISLSTKNYIDYNHETLLLQTPWYYAEFGKDRFHFVRAGVKNSFAKQYLDLTKELRVEIFMKVLWGLVPVSYDENNMVCFVKRYKTGPIRLIRRGDFHLRLGLGIKGSKASVNQICYPQMVKVPVYLHAPIRFGTFLKEVYIEMTPVLNYAENFRFIIPGTDFDKKLPDLSPSDSLILKQPNKEFMEVSDGERGYGWLLLANIPDSLLNSSCFISRKPSLRGGFADCGFKLVVNDLPKGYYDITNWVLFQTSTEDMLKEDHRAILRPLRIQTVDGRFFNSISNKLQK